MNDLSIRNGLGVVLDETLSQWGAAKESRFRRERDIPSNGSGADYHWASEPDYYKVMEYARAMERDDVVIGPGLDKAAQLTVGGGPTFKPDSGNDKYNLAWWELWEEYRKSPSMCDVSRENDWGQLCRLVHHSTLRDGDVIALAVQTGEGKSMNVATQLIEAHQIRSPRYNLERIEQNIHLGVKLDSKRARTHYYYAQEAREPHQQFDEKDLRRIQTWRQIPGMGEFRQLFHVYHPRRASQTRGVTALAPAFDTAGMFEDLNFAKLVQSLVISCIGFIKTREPGTQMPGEENDNPLRDSRLVPDVDNILDLIQPGFMLRLKPGEKLEGFSPKVPNAEFFDQAKLALTLIGNNIGLPIMILIYDASDTNFSSWRGVFDQAKEGFLSNQAMNDTRYYTPFNRLWTAVQIASQRLKVPKSLRFGNEFRHTWSHRRWPFIQPVQDAATMILRQRNLLASPRAVHGEVGQDFEQVVDHTTEDNAYAIKAAVTKAKEVNEFIKSDGDDAQPKVTWRDMISLPTYDRVSASFNINDNAEEENNQKTLSPSKTAPAQGAPE
jgi:capsid protein